MGRAGQLESITERAMMGDSATFNSNGRIIISINSFGSRILTWLETVIRDQNGICTYGVTRWGNS